MPGEFRLAAKGRRIAMKRSALVLALILAIAVPMAAQMPPPPGGPPPELVLKEVLGLSEGQVATLRDLERARADAAGALQRQVEAQQQALSAALSATPPDSGAVGALVISITSLQKQFGQVQEGFRNGFLGLLNEEQKSRVGFIQGVETALRAAGALHQLGL
jgi:Spy/CpxP family protein refolding chaperone